MASKSFLFVGSALCLLSLPIFAVGAKTVPPAEISKTVKDDRVCAKICFDCSFFSKSEIELESESLITPHQLREFQYLQYATLDVSENCVLQICGYSQNGPEPYRSGTCEHYVQSPSGDPIPAPFNIYGEPQNYTVTSVSCGCQKKTTKDCDQYTCPIRKNLIVWGKKDCAMLYEEEQCQQCYLNTFLLPNLTKVPYEAKSLIVRPGCQVTRYINGNLGHLFPDWPHSEHYTGTVSKIKSIYYEEAPEYFCICIFPVPQPEDDFGATLMSVGCGIALLGCVLYIFYLKGFIRWRSEDADYLLDDNTEACPNSDESNLQVALPQQSSENLLSIMESVEKLLQKVTANSEDTKLFNATVKKANLENFPQFFGKFKEICTPDKVLSRDSFAMADGEEAELGKGAFGKVFRGMIKASGLPVAIKEFQLDSKEDRKAIAESFLREIHTFKIIGNGCENIVRFYGACCSTDGLYLVVELCEEGSLKRYLAKKMRPTYIPNLVAPGGGKDLFNAQESSVPREETNLKPEDSSKLLNWSYQIAVAMRYLSDAGIVHVDLAPRNILLKANETIRICDFSLSRKCLDKKQHAEISQSCKFPFFSMAPELFLDAAQNPETITTFVDIWAYGCTLWQMYSLGRPLYRNMLAVRQFHRLEEPHPKPTLAPDYMYEIMVQCWNRTPENRPQFNDICTTLAGKIQLH